ncbi:MAG: CapA family protein [Bacteroidia bacterium]|nr:CapA family protein [Bacteroidia bacterium]
MLITQSGIAQESKIRVLFVGDILLSRNVRTEFQTRNSSPFEAIKPLFKSADFVIGNLEGAVGYKSDQYPSKSDSPVFDIDSTHIRLLKDAGFNVITCENNHSFDLGEDGKRKTIEALRTFEITPVYLGNSPQFFMVKDVVIAIVTINMIPGRDLSSNQIPSVEIKQKLRLACSLANMVIVSIHWGSELLEWPNKVQRETASWLIKNGADLIIGSHPHVIQKPDMVDGKPVFFSLGNHLFDQKYPQTKEGLMVGITIQNGQYQCEGITTHTKPNSFYPETGDTVHYKLEPLTFKKSTLTINNYTLKPISVSVNGQPKLILEAYQKGKRVWSTHPMSIVTITSGKLDEKHEYLFALEKHYSNLDSEISLRPYVYDIDYKGLFAKWRGSALAWPLLDAILSPYNNKILCALHRGDSFIIPDKTTTTTRVVAYQWSGFGFKGINDSTICESCRKLLVE